MTYEERAIALCRDIIKILFKIESVSRNYFTNSVMGASAWAKTVIEDLVVEVFYKGERSTGLDIIICGKTT